MTIRENEKVKALEGTLDGIRGEEAQAESLREKAGFGKSSRTEANSLRLFCFWGPSESAFFSPSHGE